MSGDGFSSESFDVVQVLQTERCCVSCHKPNPHCQAGFDGLYVLTADDLAGTAKLHALPNSPNLLLMLSGVTSAMNIRATSSCHLPLTEALDILQRLSIEKQRSWCFLVH